MCDVIDHAIARLPETSRRRFLQTLGASAVVGGLSLVAATPAAAATGGGQASTSRFRTKLVLLGTGGGPTLLSEGRAGISTAVVYAGAVYLVDLGHGAHMQLIKAGLAGEGFGGRSLTNVRSILFTHMHSDHVAEWPATYSTGMTNRVGATSDPIRVFGPGDREALPRVFPPNRPTPAVVNPERPSPGISGMTGYLDQAFAADFNDRIRDSGAPGPWPYFSMTDIDISGMWTVDEAGIPPRVAPFEIWRDGAVRITATLVDHRPTAPAFAFRFDTPDGSIVVSGDTAPSANLIELAQGADYLVHEVIDPAFADQLAEVVGGPAGQALKAHLLASHTTIEQVGRDVAEPAGVKTLVLSHIAPSNVDVKRLRAAKQGFSGDLIIGEDLMQIGVGARS